MGLVLSCVIFSTQFEVETADLNMGKLYKQSWTNNMSNVSKPKITTLRTKRNIPRLLSDPT